MPIVPNIPGHQKESSPPCRMNFVHPHIMHISMGRCIDETIEMTTRTAEPEKRSITRIGLAFSVPQKECPVLA